MGLSVICGLLGRYDCDLFGSDFFAADDGCDERYSGFTARWPAAGWEDGMVWAVLDLGGRKKYGFKIYRE